MVELLPKNKYVWLQPIDEAQKVGSIYMPGNVSNMYRLAKVMGIAECDEAKNIAVGDTVLYDTVGAVEHRIGNRMYTTVKVMNIIAVVTNKEES